MKSLNQKLNNIIRARMYDKAMLFCERDIVFKVFRMLARKSLGLDINRQINRKISKT